MKLCKFCNSSKGKNFEEGSCFLCGNALLNLPEISRKAAKELPDVPTFSLSTKIPGDWLVKEETLFDTRLSNSVSIKTFINQFLNREISKLSGKKPAMDGDVFLIIEIPEKKIQVKYNDLFIFGRYRKLVTGISQTRWTCRKCGGKGCGSCRKGKLYDSIEEEMGEVLKEVSRADDYTMHASGREDIDVTNTGRRPFIIQLKQAKIRKPDLKLAARKINEGGKVEACDMAVSNRSRVEFVSASHFDKNYTAAVESEKEAEWGEILGLKGRIIEQKTPTRVKHRRADLVRKRKILDIRLISKGKKEAEFEITTEAGTYIKELVTGDDGRTKPSFTSVLGFPVKCRELKVSKIHDEFLGFT